MGLVSILPKVMGYGKRIAKVMPEAILGNGAEFVGKNMRATKGSLFTKAKAGFKALETDIAAKKLAHGGFFKRITAHLGKIPELTKVGARAAKIKGKSTILGGMKGFFKGLGKNMPFLAAATTLLFELPNIWTATKEQGIGQGVAEVAKAGTRLAGGAAGAAIGTALLPGIGSFLGWIAGEWLTSKVVGKTYTEKKAEAEEQLLAMEEQAQQAQQAPQMGPQTPFTGTPNYNPYGYNPYGMTNPMFNYANPYSDDIMMQQLNFTPKERIFMTKTRSFFVIFCYKKAI